MQDNNHKTAVEIGLMHLDSEVAFPLAMLADAGDESMVLTRDPDTEAMGTAARQLVLDIVRIAWNASLCYFVIKTQLVWNVTMQNPC